MYFKRVNDFFQCSIIVYAIILFEEHTMKQQTYTVDNKEYSREQLIAFGKEHYPKFYWIARGLGIVFFLVGLLVMGMIGLVMLILNKAGVFDPDFPIWVFYIPLGVFGLMALAGLICFILSFVGRTEQKYINHALAYLTKVELKEEALAPNTEKAKAERILSQRDKETLARYDRLLKGGVISQEEYEVKRREILG